MRSINSKFYKSAAWLSCRRAYLEEHPLCEICLSRGEYTPAEHVHHKVWLNKYNENDPNFTLNWSNLQAVCHTCHNQIHAGTSNQPRRYSVDELGRVTVK